MHQAFALVEQPQPEPQPRGSQSLKRRTGYDMPAPVARLVSLTGSVSPAALSQAFRKTVRTASATVVAVPVVVATVGGAHAQGCVLNAGTYECSSAITTDQFLYSSDPGVLLDVQMQPGSSIDAASALQLNSNGGIRVQQPASSAIIGTNFAITVVNGSGFFGSAYGGAGNIEITTEGIITSTGTGNAAIFAFGQADNEHIIIRTQAVTGRHFGIWAENFGLGDIRITAQDDVTGTDRTGLHAFHLGQGDVIIQTRAVTGGDYGIHAGNYASGDLSVAAHGAVTGTDGYGMDVASEQGEVFLTISDLVTGGNGTAIRSVTRGPAGLVRLELQPGAGTIGETELRDNISGPPALRTDGRLVFGGDDTSRNGAFDLALWDDGTGAPDQAGNEFFGFAPILLKEDVSTFVITDSTGAGGVSTALSFDEATVTGGTLALDRGGFDDITLSMNGTPFEIQAGGALAVHDGTNLGTGVGVIGGDLNNYGTVDLSGFDTGAGTMLTVTGGYVAGSSLILDVFLGDDSSPTDRLVVGGDTAGTTDVFFNVTGGTGAQTDDGILVIDVDETSSSDGVFVLANPDATIDGIGGVLIAGAYGYRLARGDGEGGDSSQDWFLKSILLDKTRIYQPAAPVHEALPAAMAALNGLPTLRQRIGNRHRHADEMAILVPYADQTPTPDTSRPAPEESPIWMRIEASHRAVRPEVSTSWARYDVDTWQLRAGLDAMITDGRAGRVFAGLNVAYGTSRLDLSSISGGGEINTTGYTLGGTLTWHGPDGLYVDAQAHYSLFESDLNVDVLGALAGDVDGDGYAFGLEAGKRITYSSALTFIPQAQLVYASVDFESFTGPNGEIVSMDDGDSLVARLGLAVEHMSSWQAENGTLSRARVYGIANLSYAFVDATSVDVSGALLRSEPDALNGDIGVGGSYNWNDDRYALYGEASFGSSLSDPGDSYAFRFNAGLRIHW